MVNCILVGLGGALGSILRYLIGLIPIKSGSVFPIKTLVISIVGAFLIGLIVSLSAKNPYISEKLILMLKIGVCGGFTTFSTFAFETGDLISTGKVWLAILYIVLSVVLSVFAVFGGQLLVK